MSVIFEGIEMPTACCFVDGEHSAFAHFEYCKFYNICKKRDTIKTNCKPSDCPVKALEQEPILDKIRAEIETKYGQCDICEYFEDYDYEENDISEYRPIGDIAEILQIIDKYKAESEEG